MSRSLLRALAVGLFGAVSGGMWMLAVYGVRPSLRMEFDVTPPPQVTGIYTVERDPQSGLTFAWSADVLTIPLPGLDRQTAWHLEMRARAARPDPATNPELAIFADGSHVLTTPSASDFADIQVTIPARPDTQGATIAVRSSATMVPGPHDRRTLGVMFDRITLAPDRLAIAPGRALGGVAVATAVAGAAMVLVGASALSALVGTVVGGAAIAATVARGFGPYTQYPEVMAFLSLWIWASAVLFSLAARVFRRKPLSSAATFVVVFSAGAGMLKLAVLLHPGMPIGDALFHAHRFHDVLAGKLFFTSIAPGNYSFPYAPGLYVAAAPFAALVRRGAGDMALLRTIVIAADAIAGALLYTAVVRAPGAPIAGALAVVLYHVVPLEFRIATVGNLTNAFSQSIAVAALVVMATAAVLPVRRGQAALVLLLAPLLTSAFLSHTSTFAIGATATAFIATAFYLRGGTSLRPSAVAIVVALAVSVLLAVVLYYAQFGETYKTEWARISAETAAAAPDAGGRGIGARLASVPRYVYLYFGVPLLVLAAWGVVVMHRRLPSQRLTLTIDGWLIACALFLILGIVTPVDMRHYLAVIPALTIAAGFAVDEGWQRGIMPRALAGSLFAWALAIGVHTWWSTL